MPAVGMIWPIVATIAVGYLVGSFPTAWLVARYLVGNFSDLRQLGDGNMGATNIGRLFGWCWGVIVGSIDLIKGFVAVGFARTLVSLPGLGSHEEGLSVLQIAGGLSVTAGHIWPIWLRFRGGRGAAAVVGTVGAIVPVPMLIVAVPTALVLARSRDTSFAFCFIMIGSNFVAKVLFNDQWSVVAFSAVLFTLVVLTDPRLRIIRRRLAE